MIDRPQFIVRARIEARVLQAWIDEEWLIPQKESGEENFSEADLARANLIRDLKTDIGVNDEGVGVILHLIDQLHGLRKTLHDFLREGRDASRD